MPYNPSVNDISGQIMGNAYANIGNIIGNTITAYKQKTDENKNFESKSKSVENLIKTHANEFGLSKEQLDAYLSRDPNETPQGRYERLSGMIDNAVIGQKMKQFSQQQQQYAQQQAAGQELVNLGKYSQGQGVGVYSPEVQKKMQAQLADPMTNAAVKIRQLTGATPDAKELIAAQAAGVRDGAMKLHSYRSQDEQGNPIEVTIDQTTGKEIGRGPLQKQPGIPNPLNEKIYASLEDERKTLVQPAVNSLKAYDEIEKVLSGKDAEVISGAFANQKLALKKIGSALGMKSGDIENTELIKSQIAIPVAAIIKNFGSGTGLSDADREFAMRAAGGEITLEPASIKRLVAIGQQAARNVVENYNTRLDETFPDSSGEPADKRARNALKIQGYSKTPKVNLPSGWSIK